ncbi:hypothetical protein BC938DRAFT_474468, partial [Jimgerdemannia flammicorona]
PPKKKKDLELENSLPTPTSTPSDITLHSPYRDIPTPSTALQPLVLPDTLYNLDLQLRQLLGTLHTHHTIVAPRLAAALRAVAPTNAPHQDPNQNQGWNQSKSQSPAQQMAEAESFRMELEQAHALLEVALSSGREVAALYEQEVRVLKAANEAMVARCEDERGRLEELYAMCEQVDGRVRRMEVEREEARRCVEGRRGKAERRLGWMIGMAGREGPDNDGDMMALDPVMLVRGVSEKITVLEKGLVSRERRSRASNRERDVLMRELERMVEVSVRRLEAEISAKSDKVNELTRKVEPLSSDVGEKQEMGDVGGKSNELEKLMEMERACGLLRRQWEAVRMAVGRVTEEEAVDAKVVDLNDFSNHDYYRHDDAPPTDTKDISPRPHPWKSLDPIGFAPPAIDPEDLPIPETLLDDPGIFMLNLSDYESSVDDRHAEVPRRTLNGLEISFAVVMSNMHEIEKDMQETDRWLGEILEVKKDVYARCLAIEERLKELEGRSRRGADGETSAAQSWTDNRPESVQAAEDHLEIPLLQEKEEDASHLCSESDNLRAELSRILQHTTELFAAQRFLVRDRAVLETEHRSKCEEMEVIRRELLRARPGQLLAGLLERLQSAEGGEVGGEEVSRGNNVELVTMFEEGGEEEMEMLLTEPNAGEVRVWFGPIVETKLRILELESSLHTLEVEIPKRMARTRHALCEAQADLVAAEGELWRCHDRVCGMGEEVEEVRLGVRRLARGLEAVVGRAVEEIERMREMMEMVKDSGTWSRGTSVMGSEGESGGGVHELGRLGELHAEMLARLDECRREQVVIKESRLKLVIRLVEREREKIVGGSSSDTAGSKKTEPLWEMADELAEMLERVREKEGMPTRQDLEVKNNLSDEGSKYGLRCVSKTQSHASTLSDTPSITTFSSFHLRSSTSSQDFQRNVLTRTANISRSSVVTMNTDDTKPVEQFPYTIRQKHIPRPLTPLPTRNASPSQPRGSAHSILTTLFNPRYSTTSTMSTTSSASSIASPRWNKSVHRTSFPSSLTGETTVINVTVPLDVSIDAEYSDLVDDEENLATITGGSQKVPSFFSDNARRPT